MLARSFAPLLSRAGLAVSISLWCTNAHQLVACNFADQICDFSFTHPCPLASCCVGFECFSSEDGYTSFSLSHMEDDQLLVAKGRTARYELGV